MLIKSEVALNGIRLAYCIGDDIPNNFKCRKIKVGATEYDVIRSGSSKALCGKMTALMQLALPLKEKMPLGEFTIIE